jgi:hypothetical protein
MPRTISERRPNEHGCSFQSRGATRLNMFRRRFLIQYLSRQRVRPIHIEPETVVLLSDGFLAAIGFLIDPQL